jgi:hypothetical protein
MQVFEAEYKKKNWDHSDQGTDQLPEVSDIMKTKILWQKNHQFKSSVKSV